MERSSLRPLAQTDPAVWVGTAEGQGGLEGPFTYLLGPVQIHEAKSFFVLNIYLVS